MRALTHHPAMRWTRDRGAVAFVTAIVTAAVVAAAMAWSADEQPAPPAPSMTPSVSYVTGKLVPVVAYNDREACRALLLWSRSQRNLNSAIRAGDVTIATYNRAVLRCAAVGVWPTR